MNSSSNKIIQGLWVTGDLGTVQQLCIKSFLTNGHEFHLYTYNKEINAPAETVVKNADIITPAKDIFFDDSGSLCSFADMFRYDLLYENGGWWVDLDQSCLKLFDFKSEFVFSSEYDPSFRQNVNIGVIKVPPHSDIMRHCSRLAHKTYAFGSQRIKWGTLGSPIIVSYINKHHEYTEYIQSPHVFCPIPYFYYNLLFNDILIEFTEKTYGVHLWNEMLRQNKVNTEEVFHCNSFFQKLKTCYKL